MAACNVAVEHSRSAKYSYQKASGHGPWSPPRSGRSPRGLELGRVGLERGQRRGRAADPGLGEQVLAIPEADHVQVVGHAVLLAVGLPRRDSRPELRRSSWRGRGVKFGSRPEGTSLAWRPPPHCWKISGGLPDCSAAGSLVFCSSSFWIGTFLMMTLGCIAWKSWATWFQVVCNEPEVALFHHVSGRAPAALHHPADPPASRDELPPQPAMAAAASQARRPSPPGGPAGPASDRCPNVVALVQQPACGSPSHRSLSLLSPRLHTGLALYESCDATCDAQHRY